MIWSTFGTGAVVLRRSRERQKSDHPEIHARSERAVPIGVFAMTSTAMSVLAPAAWSGSTRRLSITPPSTRSSPPTMTGGPIPGTEVDARAQSQAGPRSCTTLAAHLREHPRGAATIHQRHDRHREIADHIGLRKVRERVPDHPVIDPSERVVHADDRAHGRADHHVHHLADTLSRLPPNQSSSWRYLCQKGTFLRY